MRKWSRGNVLAPLCCIESFFQYLGSSQQNLWKAFVESPCKQWTQGWEAPKKVNSTYTVLLAAAPNPQKLNTPFPSVCPKQCFSSLFFRCSSPDPNSCWITVPRKRLNILAIASLLLTRMREMHQVSYKYSSSLYPQYSVHFFTTLLLKIMW